MLLQTCTCPVAPLPLNLPVFLPLPLSLPLDLPGAVAPADLYLPGNHAQTAQGKSMARFKLATVIGADDPNYHASIIAAGADMFKANWEALQRYPGTAAEVGAVGLPP